MKDLIRSPLEFVRPMTDDEWQDLMSRASDREYQRRKRQQPKRKSAAMLDASSRQRVLLSLKRTDASASV